MLRSVSRMLEFHVLQEHSCFSKLEVVEGLLFLFSLHSLVHLSPYAEFAQGRVSQVDLLVFRQFQEDFDEVSVQHCSVALSLRTFQLCG